MPEKKKKPEIRFKGFDEDWDERKIGKITDCYSGGTPLVGNQSFYGGKIPFIRSGEINSYSTELFLTENGLKYSSAKMVEKGDILYALYGATSGEVGISGIKGAINQAILAIKPKDEYHAYFLAQWLRKKKYSIVNTYLQGGQGNLSGNIVKDLEVIIPHFFEQEKIGEYFNHLDTLITLHQRKYDKLTALKTAMLEKMFPKAGSNVPEIRFKEFTGKWDERELGDLCFETYGGGTPSTTVSEYWNGNIAWIQSSDIDNGQLSNIEPRKKITEIGLKASATKLIPENSIAIVTRVGVGKLAFMPYKYTTSQDFLSLSKLKINSWFGVYSIWVKLQSELNAVQGTSIKGITKEELLLKKILVPKKNEEQALIGNFFKQLDCFLSIQKKEFEKLKSIKKALLEKMFV